MVPIGKAAANIENGDFSAVQFAEPTCASLIQYRMSFFASELTHFKKHLTSRSSRSLRSLGHSALRTCSGLASPFSPDQALHAECRLPGRYVQNIRGNSKPRIKVFSCSPLPLVSAEAR